MSTQWTDDAPRRRSRRPASSRWSRLVGAFLAAFGTAAAVSGTAEGSTAAARASYLVEAATTSTARAGVTAVGGQVTAVISQLHTVVARLSTIEATRLGRRAGTEVMANREAGTQGATSSSKSTPSAVFPVVTGATKLWARGDTGKGVTVAVLDTGINASLKDFGGRVIGGVDLAGKQSYRTDQYGHGTFVAGLIASDGASSGGRYKGEAPDANLVSIKVANATGQVTTARIIQGIEWAIAHRAEYGIRVLNLSVGERPDGPAATDPIDQAVNQAWRAGIVVVTSAGNSGSHPDTITAPGDDPLAITVGSIADHDQVNPARFSVSSFSGVGPTAFEGLFKPDLVAPGRSVVSLADPGSAIYVHHPSARVGRANFVGTGTSFATAIVSGEVALLLSREPHLTPNEVKSRLLATAGKAPSRDPLVVGHGLSDVYAAVTAHHVPTLNQNLMLAETNAHPALTAEQAYFESTFNPANWNSLGWNSLGWNSLGWNSLGWNSLGWNSLGWNSLGWNSLGWNSLGWNSLGWNSLGWNSLGWNSLGWNSLGWNSLGWNSLGWNSLGWNSLGWNSLGWNSLGWNSLGWNSLGWNSLGWNSLGWNSLGWNSLGWNSLGWNSLGWNSLGWNSLGWNSLGWNSLGWNSLGWNSLGWNSLGWNSLGWNSLGWNSLGWNSLGWNSLGWNSLGWNSLGWNSLGWNSLGWNSLGWNSLGWNSLGWNSLGWNSLGWNSLGWNSLGWNSLGWN